MSGKVYRMSLKGELLWKAGGKEGTWTDGGAGIGNGMVSRLATEASAPFHEVFAVNNNLSPERSQQLGDMVHSPGTVSAYDLDGRLIWKVTTPRPPNNAPAIGKLRGWNGLSVVVPICQQVTPRATCDVYALDASSGRIRWVFNGPTQQGLFQAGDFEGIFERTLNQVRPMCLPNGWSAPTIAADGTVFVGQEGGYLYALRDEDGDGRVFGPDEVSFFDTKAAREQTYTYMKIPGSL